jgi:hypothetical protein
MLIRRRPDSGQPNFAVLAPSSHGVADIFARVEEDDGRHESLLAAMQRFRGRVYLADQAIRADQLTKDGRHLSSVDRESWHLVALDQEDRVLGCIRYRVHEAPPAFEDLGVSRSAIARDPQWGFALRHAVQREIDDAAARHLPYAEVGGWALDDSFRRTTAGIRLAVGAFSLSLLLGGALGLSTATQRNHSADMLRRIAGRSLEVDGIEVPPYYEPMYGCVMEILRFDCALPNPRYVPWIQELEDELSAVPIYCAQTPGFRDSLESLRIAVGHSVMSQPQVATD